MVNRYLPAILSGVVLFACQRDRPTEDAPADTVAAAPSAPVKASPLPYAFDPGRLTVGDTFLGLRVDSLDVHRAFEDSIWVGQVNFSGEIETQGVYQGHFDYPEVQAVCFHVTDSASVRRIPVFATDTHSTRMKTWFCFNNAEEAVAKLGPPDQPRHATIVIDDYTAVRYFTDAFASARLVRVVSRGDTASRTLREPF